MHSRKADLSIQVIIVAAIALVTLIVLISMFGSKIKLFGNTVGQCEENYGECRAKASCPEEQGYTSMGKLDCKGNRICCIHVMDLNK